VSRHARARLADIVAAIAAIRDHLTKGDLNQGLVYDAVRVRLIEIGEAVKGIDPGTAQAGTRCQRSRHAPTRMMARPKGGVGESRA
jgi:uncharacterized protein with HEPN domain